MVAPTLDEQIHEIIQNLSETEKRKVLSFATILGKPQQAIGEPAENLNQFIGLFDKQSLNEIQAAIEKDCGQIDWDDWE